MEENKPNLRFVVSPQPGSDDRIFPEQSAFFDMAVHNEESEPVEILAMSGNLWTPTIKIYDSQGDLLIEATLDDLLDRFAGDRGEAIMVPPKTITLAPKQSFETWVDLWSYTDPLPKGHYEFGATHQVDPEGLNVIASNRLPFEVMDACVTAFAFGYQDHLQNTSLIAWLAVPVDDENQDPRLLMRLSAISNHNTAQRSGRPLGVFPKGSKLALGAKPPEGTREQMGWLAVVGNNQAELINHFRTKPNWQSSPILLPISDAVPLDRFPDRGSAIFLATGSSSDDRSELAGVVVSRGDEAPTPWSVPITIPPTQSACAFREEGPIALLLLGEEETRDGKINTLLTRLDVDESGQVVLPERIVHTTENEVLAIAVDMRQDAPLAFLVLEAHRERHNHVALVRIPVDGRPEVPELTPLEGWPALTRYGKDYRWPPGEGGSVEREHESELRVPLAAEQVSLEVDSRGIPWMVLVDEEGDFYATRLDGSTLTLLHEGGDFKPKFLHIAAFVRSLTISCFSETGALVHLGRL